MAFNSKTYHTNKAARTAYKDLETARREKASPYCDSKRVALYVRFARASMRMHLIMRGEKVSAYPLNTEA